MCSCVHRSGAEKAKGDAMNGAATPVAPKRGSWAIKEGVPRECSPTSQQCRELWKQCPSSSATVCYSYSPICIVSERPQQLSMSSELQVKTAPVWVSG